MFPDKSYNLIAPKKTFIQKMIEYFPEEEKAIHNYIKLIEKANKASMKYFTAKTLSGIPEFLFYRSLTKQFFKYSDKTDLKHSFFMRDFSDPFPLSKRHQWN